MATGFRENEIMSRARAEGKVVADDLARDMGVTVQTIRRDLGGLSERGLLTRVHGGAVLPSGTRNFGYEDRRDLHSDAKERIGRAMAARIPNGASVFLDIGTTVEATARALMQHSDLLVVTNNLNVATILAANADIDVLLTGGILRRSDGGLVGEVTADFVRQFKVDIAVIGASALDETGDALDFDFREVRVAQAVMALARRSFLVADHSKFARAAPVRISAIGAFFAVVTDAPPPAKFEAAAKEQGTEIIRC